MSFLRYAAENCLNHRRHPRGSFVASLQGVKPHGESNSGGHRTRRHRWPSHTHGSSPMSTRFGQDTDGFGKFHLEAAEKRCFGGWIGCRRYSGGQIRRCGEASASTARSEFIGLIRAAGARGSRLLTPVQVARRRRFAPDCTRILQPEFAGHDSELADAPTLLDSKTGY